MQKGASTAARSDDSSLGLLSGSSIQTQSSDRNIPSDSSLVFGDKLVSSPRERETCSPRAGVCPGLCRWLSPLLRTALSAQPRVLFSPFWGFQSAETWCHVSASPRRDEVPLGTGIDRDRARLNLSICKHLQPKILIKLRSFGAADERGAFPTPPRPRKTLQAVSRLMPPAQGTAAALVLGHGRSFPCLCAARSRYSVPQAPASAATSKRCRVRPLP